MCGFVALLSKKNKKVDLDSLKKMNQAIVHRGPDDSGYYTNDWLGLGFQRLAIIDLSQHGHQPMLDPTGRYALVFNGEIYNYVELRQALIQEGVVFRGHSDSEVLLQAYIHWGEACLSRFIGMFAFIIADLTEQSLFIARDFPGVKPLYFTEDSDYFYFASEVKAFKQVVNLSVNPAAYSEQFNFRYVAGEKTFFNNITKVLPGEYWTINASRTLIKKTYFDLAETFIPKHSARSMSDWVEETRELLRQSFLLHTRSDVGYCVQLSGGVDSSYITAVLSESQSDLQTFSVQLDDPQFDESIHQQAVVDRYHTHHHSFKMTPDVYAEQLPRATYHLEAPIMHSGSVFLMELCRQIAKTSKVVITGEGADELFGGYWHHRPSFKQRSFFQLKKWGVQPKYFPSFSKFNAIKRNLSAEFIRDNHRYHTAEQYDYFFHDKYMQNPHRDFYAQLVDENYVNALLAYDQSTYLASVLDRQDKLSMSYSVESRVPYCHQDLYRLINSAPTRFKLYRGERKAILKKCTERTLPSSLIYRRKNGFRLPLAQWYRDEKSAGRYLSLLTDQTARQRGLYNQNNLLKVIKDFHEGSDRWAKAIIQLVNLELWHREYGQ